MILFSVFFSRLLKCPHGLWTPPQYDRRRNLDIICNAIKKATSLNVAVNSREDIVLDEKHKISGTAAKLGKDSAYHHCTVLVDVNECVLHDALNSKAEGIESRATQSVRVPVKNLAAMSPDLNVSHLQVWKISILTHKFNQNVRNYNWINCGVFLANWPDIRGFMLSIITCFLSTQKYFSLFYTYKNQRTSKSKSNLQFFTASRRLKVASWILTL